MRISSIEAIRAKLCGLADDGADAYLIADAAVTTWRAVDAALSPIIGHRGVAALFNRCVHLGRVDFRWLASAVGDDLAVGEFSALRGTLVQRSSSEAVAAHVALLQSFCDLLAELIGESLTERLLLPAWVTSTSGPPVQDDSP